ncbi:MAG TPA: pilus assembly protein [Candidatus Collinsella stercoripullorum]|nr:pilus assembly protein [Candidatus Collinsella stercoripullorum]
MRWQGRGRSISRCIEGLGDETAQATVEAAFLLPTFLTLILLALQPVCVLYTRSIMESAAAETARLAVTSADADAMRAFALRRLAAVPDVSIFHAGGPLSWEVEVARAGAGDGGAGAPRGVEVTISGAVRPLPVIGAFASALGETNASGDVLLEVTVGYEGRPGWLEGDYGEWVAIWG